jgi:predicted DNA binding protein
MEQQQEVFSELQSQISESNAIPINLTEESKTKEQSISFTEESSSATSQIEPLSQNNTLLQSELTPSSDATKQTVSLPDSTNLEIIDIQNQQLGTNDVTVSDSQGLSNPETMGTTSTSTTTPTATVSSSDSQSVVADEPVRPIGKSTNHFEINTQ